ncbi:hypothetical protein D3C85_1135920 [compost metagenome]
MAGVGVPVVEALPADILVVEAMEVETPAEAAQVAGAQTAAEAAPEAVLEEEVAVCQQLRCLRLMEQTERVPSRIRHQALNMYLLQMK